MCNVELDYPLAFFYIPNKLSLPIWPMLDSTVSNLLWWNEYEINIFAINETPKWLNSRIFSFGKAAYTAKIWPIYASIFHMMFNCILWTNIFQYIMCFRLYHGFLYQPICRFDIAIFWDLADNHRYQTRQRNIAEVFLHLLAEYIINIHNFKWIYSIEIIFHVWHVIQLLRDLPLYIHMLHQIPLAEQVRDGLRRFFWRYLPT